MNHWKITGFPPSYLQKDSNHSQTIFFHQSFFKTFIFARIPVYQMQLQLNSIHILEPWKKWDGTIFFFRNCNESGMVLKDLAVEFWAFYSWLPKSNPTPTQKKRNGRMATGQIFPRVDRTQRKCHRPQMLWWTLLIKTHWCTTFQNFAKVLCESILLPLLGRPYSQSCAPSPIHLWPPSESGIASAGSCFLRGLL